MDPVIDAPAAAAPPAAAVVVAPTPAKRKRPARKHKAKALADVHGGDSIVDSARQTEPAATPDASLDPPTDPGSAAHAAIKATHAAKRVASRAAKKAAGPKPVADAAKGVTVPKTVAKAARITGVPNLDAAGLNLDASGRDLDVASPSLTAAGPRSAPTATVATEDAPSKLSASSSDAEIEAAVRAAVPYECGDDLARFLAQHKGLLSRRPKGKPTKLHIFDFDGTLFRSPIPNKLMWTDEALLNMIKGDFNWFQDPRTLRPPYVPERPEVSWFIEPVLAAAHAALGNRGATDGADPQNHVVMLLTGRLRGGFLDRVKEILAGVHLAFDVVCCKEPPEPLFRERTAHDESQTFGFKMSFIEGVCRFVPSVREIEVWDDRPQQCAQFKHQLALWKGQRRIQAFRVNQVTDESSKCPNPALLGIEDLDDDVAAARTLAEKCGAVYGKVAAAQDAAGGSPKRNAGGASATAQTRRGPVGWLDPAAELDLVCNLIEKFNDRRRDQPNVPFALFADPVSVGIHICAQDRKELLQSFPVPPWVDGARKWKTCADYVELFEGSIEDASRPFVCKKGRLPLVVTHVGMVDNALVAARLYCAINCRVSGAPADLRMLVSHAAHVRNAAARVAQIPERDWFLLDKPITVYGVVAQKKRYGVLNKKTRQSHLKASMEILVDNPA